MKISVFTLFICLLSFVSAAQDAPSWVNANYREGSFPSHSYLVGFATVSEVSKKEVSATLNQLEAQSKTLLIESIKVQVKSVSTANVSDFNGEINDYFNQKTTTESQIELVGLKTESYYDKKTKIAYGFSYVHKMEMAEYYRQQIGKNIIDIQNIIDNGLSVLNDGQVSQSYQASLKAYNLFYEIDESQKILMAIGSTGDMDMRTMEVNQLNNDFSKFMNKILTSPKMTMEDLGFIIATGLTKAQGDKHKGVELIPFTYSQTGFTSEFSFKLMERIKQSLPSSSLSYHYEIVGVYNFEDNNVVVNASLRDKKTKQKIGNVTAQISEMKLISNNITVIPKDIQNLKRIETLSFTSQTTGAQGKSGLGLDRDLVVLVKENGQPVANVPVRFINNNDQSVYCSTISDASGLAHCRVKKISGKYKNQVILGELDLARMLDNDTSNYVTMLLKNKEIPSAKFKVSVLPSTIHIEAQENNMGTSLDVKLIEPQVKESLSNYGFEFSEGEGNEVDYVIKIRASSRKGGNVGGVYFAFVDVTISIYDVNLGKEIYKESISNVKGGGGTFDQASAKAYYSAAKDKIVRIFIQE